MEVIKEKMPIFRVFELSFFTFVHYHVSGGVPSNGINVSRYLSGLFVQMGNLCP